MKIRTIIIDDEPKAGDLLESMLEENFPQIKILGKATSVLDGISLLNNWKIDLVFLDILTDREANVFPMVAAGKGLSDMILAAEEL